MCYVGKATKIFIFLITVLVITGIILGFGLLRRTIHPKSHKCSGESCSQSDSYLPQPPDFPISSTPDPNPPDLTSTPPPPPSQSPPSGLTPNLAAPPPAAPPPSDSTANQSPPPPSPVSVDTSPPPPPVVVVAPPPGFTPVIRFR